MDPTDTGARQTFSSGGQREKLMPRFDLIPSVVLVRLADRYQLGAEKYGRDNYKKGLPVGDTLNHVVAHLYTWLDAHRSGKIPTEDHLAAALWNVATLMELEHNNALLEDEDALRTSGVQQGREIRGQLGHPVR